MYATSVAGQMGGLRQVEGRIERIRAEGKKMVIESKQEKQIDEMLNLNTVRVGKGELRQGEAVGANSEYTVVMMTGKR